MKNLILTSIAIIYSVSIFAQNIGQVKEVLAVTAEAEANWEGSFPNYKKGEDKKTSIYNPPPGWIIMSHRVKIKSRSGGTINVSNIASGLKYISEEKIHTVYKSLLEIAGQKSEAQKIKARIQDDYETHLEDYKSINTNKNTLEVKVKAKSQGNELDRRRGWIKARVYVTIEYVGIPDDNKLLIDLKKKYGL